MATSRDNRTLYQLATLCSRRALPITLLAVGVSSWACDRSPSGVLQETVPSSSPPSTPAFASNSLRTSPSGEGAAGEPTPTNADTPEVNTALAGAEGQAASGGTQGVAKDACSVAGVVHAKAVSEDRYEIKRQDVNAVAAKLKERAKTAVREELTPVRTETGLPGFRIQGVGAEAPCGLKSGDILVTINGVPVTNQKALAANKPQLLSANEIKLVIERDRKSKQLSYDIRD